MRIFTLLGIMLVVGCDDTTTINQVSPSIDTQEIEVISEGQVFLDKEFRGGRLDGFKKINDSTYQVLIEPENTPINNSPWFSFRIWSEGTTTVTLKLTYPQNYKNRYIPKLSLDSLNWEPIEQNLYEVDSISGTLSMELKLTPQKLWVSAQENLNSAFINTWMDSLVQNPIIYKEKIGESVLGQPINVMRIKERTARHAIILIGRQHPTEVPGGTMSLISFVQTILSDSDLAKSFRENFEILVFPLLNPDGVDNGNWRHNANGADLNRDWVLFNQPETRAVRDWLMDTGSSNPESEYCFGIDFHTSYSGPYLLTLDTIPHIVEPDITTNWVDKIELETSQKLDIRPRAQSLPYCYNWMINELGIEAVTYEEGDEIDRKRIKRRAINYATLLMEILLEKYY